MNFSLRDISQIIDPLEPPTSLIEVAKRHRWISGSPPNPISMRSITDRYSDPANIIRFLSYNTFLLDGFEISLNHFDLSNLLEKLGKTVNEYIEMELKIGIEDLMNRLHIDPIAVVSNKWGGAQGVAALLDVSEDALEAALDIGTGGFSWLARKVTGFSWSDVSVSKVLETAGKSAVDVLIENGVTNLEVLELMAFDLYAALVELVITIGTILGADAPPDPLRIGAKPALDERSREIGPKLMEPMNLAYGLDKSYEIIALCEVWYQEARDQLVVASPQCVHIPGPDATGPKALKGSGLYQIVLNHAVLEQPPPLVFSNRGDELRDADAWASKGVLLSRIDVGVGVIDLYSTHLYSGEGLLDIPQIGLGKLNDEDKSWFRNMQLDEFITFFNQTHNKSNIAIFCGDFNIAADSGLIKTMNEIKMEDVALRLPLRPDASPEESGGTHGTEDPGIERFDEACDRSVDTIFCRNPKGIPGGQCIDYIFIERPTEDHTFCLDVSRLRRRLFPRDKATEGQYFLSDHLGLDVTLIASKCKY